MVPPSVLWALSGFEPDRRTEAETGLRELARSAGADEATETMVLSGDPSEEIVKLAEQRQAGLIVMALHSSGLLGPRMGSVTYRLLCLSHSLILALPPTDQPLPEPAAIDALASDIV